MPISSGAKKTGAWQLVVLMPATAQVMNNHFFRFCDENRAEIRSKG
jgi:hypothetical protein